MKHVPVNDWCACLIFLQRKWLWKGSWPRVLMISWVYWPGLAGKVRCTTLQVLGTEAFYQRMCWCHYDIKMCNSFCYFHWVFIQVQIQHRKISLSFFKHTDILNALFLLLIFFFWLSLSDWLLTLTSRFFYVLYIFPGTVLCRLFFFFLIRIPA